jgi:hypothetical protein
MSAYAEGLRDAWEGELFGDLLLRGLSEQLDLPEERRAIFRTLADIEAAMAARLEPLVPAEVRAGAPDRAAARAAASLADLPDMAAVLARGAVTLPAALTRFEVLLAEAPEEHRVAVELLVAHEVCLIDTYATDDVAEQQALVGAMMGRLGMA